MHEITPLVTVITPTYNHERHIRQCIDSVLAQTETRWEQIVVDDGSTDDTGDVVRSYDDPRIRYIRLDHVGISALATTYNRALDLARGPLVAILEGDDEWPAGKIAAQLPLFDNPAVVMSWGRAGVIDTTGTVVDHVPDARTLARTRRAGNDGTFASLLRGNYIPACTVMCRRAVLLEIGGFRQPAGLPNVDWPTWLELCRRGSCVQGPGVLGLWRRHAQQITSLMADDMLRNSEWIQTYFAQLPASERLAVDLRPQDLRHLHEQNVAATRFLQGREALRDHDRGTAQRLFREALRGGSAGTRGRAALGLICERSGLNLEFFLEKSARLRLTANRYAQRIGRRHGSVHSPNETKPPRS